MSASQEMTDISVSKLGIIAGGGVLPALLAQASKQSNIDVFIAAIQGQADESLLDDSAGVSVKLGQANTIIKAFQKEGIQDLVLIGSIERPSFSALIPDLKAAKFLAKHALKPMGDSDLLSALRSFLESEGFVIHGIQDFVPDLLTPEDTLTKTKPSQDDWSDVHRGVDVLKGMTHLDVGQAVIVQEGLILGVEAIEGTSALIERCGDLKRKGRKGVLVKLCKSQQDTSLDLPTIGLKTLEKINEAGFGGVVLHAQKSLIINKEELVSYANKHHLYIVGIAPETVTV